MATFITLATCHHCNLSTRHGLVYRDSLSALSRNLMGPGCCYRPPSLVPRLHLVSHRSYIYNKHCSKLQRNLRAHPPEAITLAHSKPANVKNFVFSQLRKLLTLRHNKRCREQGLNILV